MHQRIIIAVLLALVFTLTILAQETPPPETRAEATTRKCSGKPNGDIQCDVWSKNGIAVDLHPHKPAVTFTIKAWESHVGWPAVTYTITQESQRGTYYRFVEGVAWLSRPFNVYFEAWITDCRAGGAVIRCSSAFDFYPAN
jgi:hypothetical protein